MDVYLLYLQGMEIEPEKISVCESPEAVYQQAVELTQKFQDGLPATEESGRIKLQLIPGKSCWKVPVVVLRHDWSSGLQVQFGEDLNGEPEYDVYAVVQKEKIVSK